MERNLIVFRNFINELSSVDVCCYHGKQLTNTKQTYFKTIEVGLWACKFWLPKLF